MGPLLLPLLQERVGERLQVGERLYKKQADKQKKNDKIFPKKTKSHPTPSLQPLVQGFVIFRKHFSYWKFDYMKNYNELCQSNI